MEESGGVCRDACTLDDPWKSTWIEMFRIKLIDDVARKV